MHNPCNDLSAGAAAGNRSRFRRRPELWRVIRPDSASPDRGTGCRTGPGESPARPAGLPPTRYSSWLARPTSSTRARIVGHGRRRLPFFMMPSTTTRRVCGCRTRIHTRPSARRTMVPLAAAVCSSEALPSALPSSAIRTLGIPGFGIFGFGISGGGPLAARIGRGRIARSDRVGGLREKAGRIEGQVVADRGRSGRRDPADRPPIRYSSWLARPTSSTRPGRSGTVTSIALLQNAFDDHASRPAGCAPGSIRDPAP